MISFMQELHQLRKHNSFNSIIHKQVDDYLKLCKNFASTKKSASKKQHVYPRFLLDGFTENNSNRLQNVRYELSQSGKINTRRLDDITPDSFTKRINFYTAKIDNPSFETSLKYGGFDPFRAEKLFSVIEGNASAMLKFRQQEKNYNGSILLDPYFYPDDESDIETDNKSKNFLKTEFRRRIVLSTFFAMQYLRSDAMFQKFITGKLDFIKKSKRNIVKHNQNSFGDFILALLPYATISFYKRSWRWIHLNQPVFVLEKTQVVTWDIFSSNLDELNKSIDSILDTKITEENLLVFPVGPRSVIFFLPEDSFLGQSGHDRILNSKSDLLHTIIIRGIILTGLIDMSNSQIQRDKQIGNFILPPSADISKKILTEKEDIGIINKQEIYHHDSEIPSAVEFLSPCYDIVEHQSKFLQ